MKANNAKVYLVVILITCLGLANLFVWFRLVNSAENRVLTMKVFDVGQGDSIFIRTPDNYKILVDGGPNNKIVDYLNKELSLNDREIDLLILTHPQSDHLYGFIEVLRKFTVNKVVTSNVKHDTSLYNMWLDTLKSKNLTPTFVSAGNSITLSDRVTLEIVSPTEAKPNVTDLNEAAVVFKLSYGDFDALLTGDADQKTQPYKGRFEDLEVLKVPHHGSKTALLESFLKVLQPEVSIMSLSATNSYGHPSPVLTEMLNKYSNKVLRTDQDGTVTIESDGSSYQIFTDN